MSNARELAELGGSYGTGGFVGMKNRIINGAMMIDQRNAGASVTPASPYTQYTVDRFYALLTVGSKFSVQQNAGSVTPPSGFTNYLGATSLSAYSVGAGDIFALCQGVEGFNTADLSWGTASAATVTLSFWVRSSLTGTFGGSLQNGAQNYSYPFTYTISAANTWEQKTITVAGPTAGTWTTNNTAGIVLNLAIGAGSTSSGTAGAWTSADKRSATGATSVVGTSGATFYITGVQLEKGSTATSFDYRPYGTELALCQRYYLVTDVFWGVGGGAGNSTYMSANFQVPMRTAPSLSATGILRITDGYAADYNQSSANASIDSSRVSVSGVSFQAANFTGLTTGRFYISRVANTSNIALSAEL